MRGSLLSRVERLEQYKPADPLVIIFVYMAGKLMGYRSGDQFITRRGNETDKELRERAEKEILPTAWGGIVMWEERE